MAASSGDVYWASDEQPAMLQPLPMVGRDRGSELLAPIKWRRDSSGDARTLEACGRNLLEGHEAATRSPRHAWGEDSDGESLVPGSVRVKCAKCAVCVCTTLLLGLLGLVVFGMVMPWGAAAYNQELVDILENFARRGIRLSSTCLYKQYNNGARWSGPKYLGMSAENAFEGRAASPDFVFYHHQGNLLEILEPNNKTSWMQVTFNRFGLSWRIIPSPAPYDTLRYTKECYLWCGSLQGQNGDPKRFAEWQRTMQEVHYSGFRLNCLQFSQQVWEFLAPTNVGCLPKHLTTEGTLLANRTAEERRRVEAAEKEEARKKKEEEDKQRPAGSSRRLLQISPQRSHEH